MDSKCLNIFLHFFILVTLSHQIVSLGPTVKEFGKHAGFYNLPRTQSAKMFYFFFESRNNMSDPVVIWLTGGPGSSSSFALFYENGPVKIKEDLSLLWNDFGWDKVSNIIYVDQPVGTGFSIKSDARDLRHDETGVSNDLYDFLQAFFKDHPEFAKNDFYITGESYAGHYIPAFASRIHMGNLKNEGIHINLKGFAIGNGLTNPEIQYGAYGDYALEKKLISNSDHEQLKKDYGPCQRLTKQCNREGGSICDDASRACDVIYLRIMERNPAINEYDVRKTCDDPNGGCYDFSRMVTYLNQKNVQKALGVGNIEFKTNNKDVYDALERDWMINLDVKIPPLLEDGIKVLIYAGEYDFICNWLGNYRWVRQMNWSGQKNFGTAKTVPFLVDGKEAGLMKYHGPLTFLKVHDAGHLVPMDQPKASLQMIQNWMEGKLHY